MPPAEHRRLTDALLPTVLAAARLEMGYFATGCAVETKSDDSPVTIADQQAEAMIVDALEKILPGVPIVGEEAYAAGRRPEGAVGDGRFLLVDALDGTKQFVSGRPEFTINIAIVEGSRPVYGLIYAPALNDLLVTLGPQTAFRARIQPADRVTTLSDGKPVTIRVAPAFGAIVALQSRSRNLDQSNVFLSDYPVAERRQLGSSYKFCLIAAGVADMYAQFGETREWDTAAGEAILLASGGYVADFDGLALIYGKRSAGYLNRAFIASSAPPDHLRRRP